MRYIPLLETTGPAQPDGQPNAAWLATAAALTLDLMNAPDKTSRDAIIDANEKFWGQLRDWLLSLSHDKCWYSEARGLFSVLEVEHYRPKKRCKRQPKSAFLDGYWWLAFDWNNYRLCGKIGNAKKQDFFPLNPGSPVSTPGGLHYRNEIPLLLDPARAGDPELLGFNEDGSCVAHADADKYTERRVSTTVNLLNLNQSRVKKARQRVWNRCRQLIEECRAIVIQMSTGTPGSADNERLLNKKEELRNLVKPQAEFSATAKQCLLKSNIHWAMALAAG